ncbi:MAG: thioredoxin family protein [bacterium]|nr:thioredoxin family protein [bacterium]
MKKRTQTEIEKIKTGAIIVLGIIVIFGLVYILSENTGDRSNDKAQLSSAETSNEKSTNPLLEEGEEIKDEERSSLTSITYSELKKAVDNKEKKFVFLGSEQCGWCIYQKPILEHLVYEYDVEIYYLNVGNMTSDDYSGLASLHDDLARFGTPTFIVIENGKVTTVDSGARGTNGMLSLLSSNDFISD